MDLKQSTSHPSGDAAPSKNLTYILKTSRDKLQAVFDTVRDPIISFTPHGEVESLNRSMADMIGRHPREIAGREYTELPSLAAPEYLTEIEQLSHLIKTLIGRETYHRQIIEDERKGGTRFWEARYIPVLNPEGGLSLAVLQFSDITDLKLMEAKIRHYNQTLELKVAERTAELSKAWADLKHEKQALEEANLELKRLDQLRHDLTEMVVHDMKGPLAEVIGNLDLMRYEPLSPTQEEFMDMAVLGGNDLQRMIMNLLDIGRMEEGRLILRPKQVDFSEMAGSVRDMFRTVTKLKGLTVSLEDRTKGSVHMDEGLISRVIQNLLTNAIAYTPEEGTIDIEAWNEPDGAFCFLVRDTGEGIPEKNRSRIFKKFMQAHMSEGPRTSTGLGLAFCKLAVDAHQGRIWFESQEKVGTTFYVSLPPDACCDPQEELEGQPSQAVEEGS
jgi:PAS domain S-box-containing protein